MKNKRYKKRNKKQKASQEIKKIKYWLWYEKKLSPKLSIKNAEAARLFFKYHNLTLPKNRSLTRFILDLKESGKYDVLNKRCVRKPRSKRKNGRDAYLNYLQSEEWQKKRDEVFSLRGRRCERCQKDLSNMIADVHHKTYDRLFNEDMEDLEVLCRPCHKQHHKKDRKHKKETKPKTKKKNPVVKKLYLLDKNVKC